MIWVWTTYSPMSPGSFLGDSWWPNMGSPCYRVLKEQISLRDTHTVFEFYWVLFRLMVAPSHPGYLRMARALHVWYDPVPRALKHGNYLESAMPVGGGLIVNCWLDPQKTGIWLTHRPLQGCGGNGATLMSLGRSLGMVELNRSLVILSAEVPWKSGGLYLFPDWGWWWQIQQSVKSQPFWMFECYF